MNTCRRKGENNTNLSCASSYHLRPRGTPWLRQLQNDLLKRRIPVYRLEPGRTLGGHGNNVDLPLRCFVWALWKDHGHGVFTRYCDTGAVFANPLVNLVVGLVVHMCTSEIRSLHC